MGSESWEAMSPTLWSCVELLLCASLAPSGGHAALCSLPCLDKFLTFQPGSPALIGDSLGVGTLEGEAGSPL